MQNTVFLIYKITNKVNDKVYIGKHQTTNINDGYMGSGKLLKRAIKKHGKENFTKEILHQFNTEQEMNDKESELVTEEFCLREDTYNICVGGQGGFSFINKKFSFNEYSKRNKSSSHKRKQTMREKYDIDFSFQTKEGKRKLKQINRKRVERGILFNGKRASFKGKNHSEETKQKMRKIKNVGNNNSQYGTMWISNGTQNKKIKRGVDFIPEGWYEGRKMNK